MARPSTFVPFKPNARHVPAAKGVADFLRGHDKMAALLPSVTRMAKLQSDCAATLPSMFATCGVVQFESGQLVLSTPNAALASKLKQQLPKLQEGLQRRGWQVSAIRLKVQVGAVLEQAPKTKQLRLPDPAVAALTQLESRLETSPRNAALLAAISALVKRQR
jgi:uncharacterized protein YhdP